MFRAKCLPICLLILLVLVGLWMLGGAYVEHRFHVEEVEDLHFEPKPEPVKSDLSTHVPPAKEVTLVDVISQSGDERVWTSRNPAAFRAQNIEVNSRLLEVSLDTLHVGDTLRIALFDGDSVSAKVIKTQLWGRASETLGVTASLPEDAESFVTLSSAGGVLRAWIHDAQSDRDYQLRYDVPTQSHVLLEVDTVGSEVYGCGNDDHYHLASPLSDELEDSNGDALAGDALAGATVLDVMVVYTNGALAVEGSLANMEANISESFLKANLVHAKSLTGLELNVVHTIEVDYDESYSATNDLYALSRFDDAFDHIHYLREYVYFADFVSFFVDTKSAGGLGFRPSTYDRIDYGYNLIEPQISFYYHMNDSGSGQMGNLYFEISIDGGRNWDRLLARSGGQGNQWTLAEIDLTAYVGQVVRIHFRADIGSGYRSDVAIDSILIEDAVAGDPPVTFAAWLQVNHPDISDTSLDGDPDGDGVQSFLEYALGRSPEDFESGGLLTSEINLTDRKFMFSFTRGQENVRYIVQSVSDLSSWIEPDIEWDSSLNPAPANLVNVGDTQTVEIDMSGSTRFVRLNVSE